ncbi:MAG: 50S ribosomal protein L24 [Endomicrobium sp.]|jgi:large subunit ribosomal protein L24|nr:50S ribosomal protein L24 [Endomicrobium sp.]
MLKIKKKDNVLILSGKDRGKKGEVLDVFPKKGKVIVSKVNFIKKHLKTTQKQSGGIYEKEAPIYVSKVMLLCPKCMQASRPRFDTLSDSGKKVRICRKCRETIV